MKLPDNFQVVNETGIYGFFNEFRYLSNFHMVDIVVDGIKYPSTEHAYMAAKSNDLETKLKIASLETASKARSFGQKIELRDDWEFYRVAAMLNCLYHKFSPGTELADMLLSTGDKYLEETNWWGDKFWGVHKPVEGATNHIAPGGLNMLGKNLMLVRDYLKTH